MEIPIQFIQKMKLILSWIKKFFLLTSTNQTVHPPTSPTPPRDHYEVNSWNIEIKRVHKTRTGKKVRSKQEKEFYNWLQAHQIPFHYEPYLRVQEKKLFPDFVIGRSAIELTEGGAMNLSFQGSLKKYAHHLNEKYYHYSQVDNFQTMYIVMENPLTVRKLKRFLNKEIICLSNLEKLKSIVREEFALEVRSPSQSLNTQIE